MPAYLFSAPSSIAISCFTASMRGSFSCALYAANRSSSLFSITVMPRSYSGLIGALQARKS
jgi:hypothetical protein